MDKTIELKAVLTERSLNSVAANTLKNTYVPIIGNVEKINNGFKYNNIIYSDKDDFIKNVCQHNVGDHLGRAMGKRPGNVEIGNIDLFYNRETGEPIYWNFGLKFIPDTP